MSQPNECCHSDYRLCFKLKQHTPIIHFQADQKGATLRATELKPKLDRFLLEKLGEGDYEEGIKVAKEKKWLVGDGEHPALDYKVKIIPLEALKTFEIAPTYKDKFGNRKPLPFPTFFASIDKKWLEKSEKIKFSFCESYKLMFVVFNKDLKEAIEKKINDFFFFHNFGMRQSKGFGSFGIGNILNDNYYSFDLNIETIKKYQYTFLKYNKQNEKKESVTVKFENLYKKVNNNIKPEYENIYKEIFLLFNAIDIFYKTLRSGLNINKFYFKSLMFLYAKDELKTQWDKKLFKSTFLNNDYIEEQLEKHRNSNCKEILTYATDNKYLLRDCLGLSTIQEYNFNRKYKNSEKFTLRHPITDKNKLDRYKGKIVEPNNIHRMQSPILIKPIKVNEQVYKVYIIPKKYPNEVFDEEITILKVTKNNNQEKVEDRIDNLKLYPNFNMQEYFDFAFSKDIGKHIKNCGTSLEHLESQLLLDIYNQLNDQNPKYKKLKGTNHD